MNLDDIDSIKRLYEALIESNRDKDKLLLHGLAVERRHGELVLEWIKKLKPNASIELLTAGLFHDIDRIVNERTGGGFAGNKLNGPEYAAYKKEHARRSANFTHDFLSNHGYPLKFAKRVAELIAHHDDAREELYLLSDPEEEVLVAADSFAFFDSFIMKLYEKRGTLNLEEKISFMAAKMLPAYRKVLRETKLDNPLFQDIKDRAIDRMGEAA